MRILHNRGKVANVSTFCCLQINWMLNKNHSFIFSSSESLPLVFLHLGTKKSGALSKAEHKQFEGGAPHKFISCNFISGFKKNPTNQM